MPVMQDSVRALDSTRRACKCMASIRDSGCASKKSAKPILSSNVHRWDTEYARLSCWALTSTPAATVLWHVSVRIHANETCCCCYDCCSWCDVRHVSVRYGLYVLQAHGLDCCCCSCCCCVLNAIDKWPLLRVVSCASPKRR